MTLYCHPTSGSYVDVKTMLWGLFEGGKVWSTLWSSRVSVLWLIYSHKSWGSDVHLFREYQSLSCHQSLPTSLFDISTVSLLTNGSGSSREDWIFTMLRRKDVEHHSDLLLTTTCGPTLFSQCICHSGWLWIVSMTWLRIRSNSNSQKTRGWWHTVSEN